MRSGKGYQLEKIEYSSYFENQESKFTSNLHTVGLPNIFEFLFEICDFYYKQNPINTGMYFSYQFLPVQF